MVIRNLSKDCQHVPLPPILPSSMRTLVAEVEAVAGRMEPTDLRAAVEEEEVRVFFQD